LRSGTAVRYFPKPTQMQVLYNITDSVGNTIACAFRIIVREQGAFLEIRQRYFILRPRLDIEEFTFVRVFMALIIPIGVFGGAFAMLGLSNWRGYFLIL